MNKALFQQALLRFVGLPYIWGGDDAVDGFDCSGLVQECLAMLGLDPPGDQSADALYRYFLRCSKPHTPDVGALAFFGTQERVTHVAILVDGVTMLEAGGGGSKTLTAADAAKQNAYARIRPVDRRKDLVMVLRPDALPW